MKTIEVTEEEYEAYMKARELKRRTEKWTELNNRITEQRLGNDRLQQLIKHAWPEEIVDYILENWNPVPVPLPIPRPRAGVAPWQPPVDDRE